MTTDFPSSRARAHYLSSLERKIFVFHDEFESSAHVFRQLKPFVDALDAQQIVLYSCNGPDSGPSATNGESANEFCASWSLGDEHRMHTHTIPFIRSVIARKGSFFSVIGLGKSAEIAARFAEQYNPSHDTTLDFNTDEVGADYPIFVASPLSWFLVKTKKPSTNEAVLDIPIDHLVSFITRSVEAGQRFDPDVNHGRTLNEMRAIAQARKAAQIEAMHERTAYNANRKALKAVKEAGDDTIVIPPKLPKLHSTPNAGILRDTSNHAASPLSSQGTTPKYQKFVIDAAALPDPQRPFHSYITNPAAEPVAPTTISNLASLISWLNAGNDMPPDELRVDFERGSLLQRNGLAVDLCKQVVGGQGIGPILTAVGRNKNVGRFLLGNNVTGSSGAEAMATFLGDPSLSSHVYHFYIAGNNLDSEGIKLIAESLHSNTTLQALWLKRNPVLPAGAHHLANMLRVNTTLQILDLVNCGIMDEGAIAIFDALRDATLSTSGSALRHLYMGTNGLTPKTAKAAALLLSTGKSKLKTLFFACGRLQDEGAEYLAEGLKEDKELMRLGLASECITKEGAMKLVDAIREHPKLCVLDLGFRKATFTMGEWPNVIGDEGVDYIIRALLSPSPSSPPRIGIRSLNLTNTSCSPSTLHALLPLITSNTQIQSLNLHQFAAKGTAPGSDAANMTKEVEKEVNRVCERNKAAFTEYGERLSLVGDGEEKGRWEDVKDALEPRHLDDIFSVYRTNM